MQAEQLLSLYPPLEGRLTVLDETVSTNSVVKDMLRSGAKSPVVIARSQTGGKGRGGRSFGSPPGTGLYLTMGIPPLPDLSLPLTAFVGSCVLRAAKKVCDGSVAIKWVNDVLINEKKVCGILCEAIPEGVAIGIGVNVNTPALYFEQAGLLYGGSILSECGKEVSLSEVASYVIEAVDNMTHGLASPSYIGEELSFYRRNLITLGREVNIVAADGSARRGFALDIDDNANLIVDFGGTKEIVNFGDVSVRGIYGYV